MAVGNIIVLWIIYLIFAWIYGALVQHVFAYERVSHIVTMSIGAIGVLIGKYVLPGFMNLHPIFNVGGLPLISSLIGSFILPGIMWILRKDKIIFGGKNNSNSNNVE